MGGRRRVHGGQRVTRRRFTGRLYFKLWYDEFRAEEHFPRPLQSQAKRERDLLSEISPVNIQNFSSTSRRECLVSLCRIVGSWLALGIDVKRMALNIMKLALGELSVDVTILWGIPTGLLCALEGTYGKVLPRQRKFWIRVERIVKDVWMCRDWRGRRL